MVYLIISSSRSRFRSITHEFQSSHILYRMYNDLQGFHGEYYVNGHPVSIRTRSNDSARTNAKLPLRTVADLHPRPQHHFVQTPRTQNSRLEEAKSIFDFHCIFAVHPKQFLPSRSSVIPAISLNLSTTAGKSSLPQPTSCTHNCPSWLI